ncbi:MAG: hypothetical protein KKF62_12380 [Bacteroidetes bacterium]|nr:hypothetical protein [Bacteroidota bacterium]MBU1116708.1 hypothetical protein [Bacteroidota bacterium]MBU1799824.1 hypothetical protein [Bacteroidota bacterium]
MGTKQLLLIAISVFVVVIAVIFGFKLFSVSFADQVKDITLVRVHEIGMTANLYRKKPVEQGGGDGSYVGFKAQHATRLGADVIIKKATYTESDNKLIMNFTLKNKGENGKLYRVWARYEPDGLDRVRVYEPDSEKWVWIFKR